MCWSGDSGESGEILREAESKLREIQTTKFLPVAQELNHEDPYQFIRAYSPGKFLHNFLELEKSKKNLGIYRQTSDLTPGDICIL